MVRVTVSVRVNTAQNPNPNPNHKRPNVGGPNKAHTLGGKCLQDSISQRLVQNLAHIWVNLLGIVRLQNIDLQLIIYP